MAKPEKDGGPAFPVPYEQYDCGMTLRDWFAGMAMQGLAHAAMNLTSNLWLPKELGEAARQGYSVNEHLAGLAYGFADAMIEARKMERL